jgi:hypothetical protein
MIHPHQVAHRNYLLWEQTIDAYLRSHEWAIDPVCYVPLTMNPESISPLLDRYEEAGWDVVVESDEKGTSYSFRMPDHLVKDR